MPPNHPLASKKINSALVPNAGSRENVESVHESTANDSKHVVHPVGNHRLCEGFAGGHGGGAGPPCRVLGPGGGGGEKGGARLVGPRQVLGEGEEGTSPPHDSRHPGNDLGGKGGGVGFITSDEDWFHRFVEPLYSYP